MPGALFIMADEINTVGFEVDPRHKLYCLQRAKAEP